MSTFDAPKTVNIKNQFQKLTISVIPKIYQYLRKVLNICQYEKSMSKIGNINFQY